MNVTVFYNELTWNGAPPGYSVWNLNMTSNDEEYNYYSGIVKCHDYHKDGEPQPTDCNKQITVIGS